MGYGSKRKREKTMKNTNSKEYKASVKAYLIPIIEDRAKSMDTTIQGNPFAWIIGVAKSEVKHEFDRHGEQAGLCSWLQGLGMGIDFANYDIVQLAQSWHGCKLTDKQAEKVIENWFNHIALKILQFSR